ncbi:hypothetical protein RND71_043388 [Anisodus tanguticus]|uniref:dihydropyrimidinase n=1 Tax=Anisodus tanguticus TaxID=243964 RepID=A0AAE1QNW6_9SOLA|nr:hypothetical protein RND71_043388 [Anisodus tanguticus]
MGTRTADDFYSGTKAALAGGTTMIIDFVAPVPVSQNGSNVEYSKDLSYCVDYYSKIAAEQSCCDYAFHVVISKYVKDKTEQEMAEVVQKYGINSFKVFMAYKDALMLRDDEILKVFEASKKLGVLPMVHAENGDLIAYQANKLIQYGITGPEGHLQSRPEAVEAESTGRAIMLANQVRCPLYIVHIMSKGAANQVVLAKTQLQTGCSSSVSCGSTAFSTATASVPVPLFAETLGAALGSDGSNYFHTCWRHAAGHVLSPPLRNDKSTPDHLANLLGCGMLDSIGSDHCVFKTEQKEMGKNDFRLIPNGVNGIEERLLVAYEKCVVKGKLDLCKFVAVTSSNIARMFNIYPKKGRIAPGCDADIVIWGLKPKVISAQNHHSQVDFNVFEGFRCENSPIYVICNGKVVVKDGQVNVTKGSGKYIRTEPFSPYVYSKIKNLETSWPPIRVDRKQAQSKNLEQKMQQLSCAIDSSVGFDGPPSPTTSTISNVSNGSSADGFHRIKTRSGVKNLQDSTFKLTGEQIDDDRRNRTNIKVHNPPGGKSHGLW